MGFSFSGAAGAAGGDLTGVFPSPTIAAGKVTNADLAGSIDPAKITGTAAVLGANTFTGNQSVTGTVTTSAGVGFNGAAAQAKAAAYTQTYSTASRTQSNLTAVAVATTGSTSTLPFGYTTAAQADAIPVAINALEADVANVKQVLNSVVDDLQALGLVG